MCSYLEKHTSGAIAPHLTSRWKRRFIVLTRKTLHWFKRESGCDLFGEELGSVALDKVTSAKPCVNPNPDDPGSDGFFYFQIEAKEEGMVLDTLFLRQFRAPTKERRDEWVRALQMTVTNRFATVGRTPRKQGGNVDDDKSFSLFEKKRDGSSGSGNGGGININLPSRRTTLDGVTTLLPPWDDDGPGQTAAEICPVVPVTATVNGRIVGSLDKGDLPVTFGYNSRPLSVLLSPSSILVLHLSTGQTIPFLEAELREAGEGTEKVLAVPPVAPTLRARFEEAGEVVVEVASVIYLVAKQPCAKTETTAAGDGGKQTETDGSSSSGRIYSALKDGGVVAMLALFALRSRSNPVPPLSDGESATCGGDGGGKEGSESAPLPPLPLPLPSLFSLSPRLDSLLDSLSTIDLAHVFGAWLLLLLLCHLYTRFFSTPSPPPTFQYSLTLLALTFPTPAEAEEEEQEIEENSLPPAPSRFVSGTKDQGGLKEAERRWKITHEWRLSEGIDEVLLNPIPEFAAIKDAYPLFYCQRTKEIFDDGKGGKMSHVCYYEQIGRVDFDKCASLGMPAIKKFVVFVVEFV